MRLATFNLLHGRSPLDGRVEPGRLAEAARRIGADVLCLQEVDSEQPRSGGARLTEAVASAVGAAHWHFAAALHGTPGGRWSATTDPTAASVGPAYGVAIVSALPVRRWQTLRLPAAPLRSPVLVPGRRRPVLLADEPRVALAAEVETPAGRLTVVTTHLSFVPGWNVLQLLRITRALGALPPPLLLLGDLNLPGPVPAAVSGWRSLARTATYPAWRPRVQLDHALAPPGSQPHVSGAAARALPVSDHCALIVDLAGCGGLSRSRPAS